MELCKGGAVRTGWIQSGEEEEGWRTTLPSGEALTVGAGWIGGSLARGNQSCGWVPGHLLFPSYWSPLALLPASTCCLTSPAAPDRPLFFPKLSHPVDTAWCGTNPCTQAQQSGQRPARTVQFPPTLAAVPCTWPPPAPLHPVPSALHLLPQVVPLLSHFTQSHLPLSPSCLPRILLFCLTVPPPLLHRLQQQHLRP